MVVFGANLKNLLVCCAPTYPPKLALPKKIYCHSEAIFIFHTSAQILMIDTTFRSSKTVFLIAEMLHRL